MRPFLLAVLGALLFSLGCAKEPPPEKKSPPRRLSKPGQPPGVAPQKP